MAAKKSSSSRHPRRSSRPTTDGPGPRARALRATPCANVTAMRRRSPLSDVLPLLMAACAGASAVALALPARGMPQGEVPYRILAGPYPKKAAHAGGETTSTFNLNGVAISVEFLGPEARAAFVRTAVPGASDPFAAPPGRPEIYHAVRVTFENDSSV